MVLIDAKKLKNELCIMRWNSGQHNFKMSFARILKLIDDQPVIEPSMICTNCNGKGYIQEKDTFKKCSVCNGDGYKVSG